MKRLEDAAFAVFVYVTLALGVLLVQLILEGALP